MPRRRRAGDPFPPPESATPDGIVAIGALPHPELLKIAYRQGIFPWPHEGLPLLWFSPDPRFVLVPEEAHLHQSLKKTLRRGQYTVTFDTAFEDVMRGCQEAYRPGQYGTWITSDIIEGYTALHAEGVAHSVEAWRGDELVGGLYGVSFGRVFFGESMFARATDASKTAFATLLANLIAWGFDLVDCQSYTDHLSRFGAVEWPRRRFLDTLARALEHETREGPWTVEVPPEEAARVIAEARKEPR